MSLRVQQSVGVVGAGVSGICAAITLLQAGCRDVTVYEKASDLGGTWRDNSYPGLFCDLPARGYCYSFAPNGTTDALFADGKSLHAYLRRIAGEFGVVERIQLDTEVVEARWSDGGWTLSFDNGGTARHDAIMLATGYLHHPKLPKIDGMDTFGGQSFHSAQWPAELDTASKRVAVIGSGSTGIQIVTALGLAGTGVKHFQRTPSWVLPMPNLRYPRSSVALHRRFPTVGRHRHALYMRAVTILSQAGIRDGLIRKGMRAFARHGLRQVRDQVLRAALTPDYEILCKRPVISRGYYEAVQRPSVQLLTEPIDRIVPDGVRTVDGRVHDVDIIVYATGFDTHAYMRPMQVYGANGVALEDYWHNGVAAHRTVMVPGFPNMFLTTGPHSPVATASIVQVAEDQSAFMVRALQRVSLEGAIALHPKDEAIDDYYRRLRPAVATTVWATGGCQSWFQETNGDVDLWPWGLDEHSRQLRELILDEYELVQSR